MNFIYDVNPAQMPWTSAQAAGSLMALGQAPVAQAQPNAAGQAAPAGQNIVPAAPHLPSPLQLTELMRTTGPAGHLQFSPNGQYASLVDSGNAQVWAVDLTQAPPQRQSAGFLRATAVASRFNETSDAVAFASEYGDTWVLPMTPQSSMQPSLIERDLNVIDFNFSPNLGYWAALTNDDSGDYQDVIVGSTQSLTMGFIALPYGIRGESIQFLGASPMIAVQADSWLRTYRIDLFGTQRIDLTQLAHVVSDVQSVRALHYADGLLRLAASSRNFFAIHAGPAHDPLHFQQLGYHNNRSDAQPRVDFSAEGRYVVAQYPGEGASANQVFLIDQLPQSSAMGQTRFPIQELFAARATHCQRVNFSADSTTLLLTPVLRMGEQTPNTTCLVYDLRNPRITFKREWVTEELSQSGRTLVAHAPTAVALSPRGDMVLTSSKLGLVQIGALPT